MDINTRHGGPYDRGRADSYYRRGRKPHYYKGGTYTSNIVTEERMTLEEINEYYFGFDENDADQNFKEYE